MNMLKQYNATPLTDNMHVKWLTIKENGHYKHDKHKSKGEKFKNDTVGQGLPPPLKKGNTKG